MIRPWLTMVGIGEDGVAGLSAAARHAIVESRFWSPAGGVIWPMPHP